jgi:hypothetical protein
MWKQKGVFESQGIDGDFGIDFLCHVREAYGDNLNIMSQLLHFVARYGAFVFKRKFP